MSTPGSPRRKKPDPIWGRYSPTCLAIFGGLSVLLMIVIIASWLPPYEISGSPYYQQPVQYVPSGIGIGFIIITGRQLYLRKQSRRRQFSSTQPDLADPAMHGASAAPSPAQTQTFVSATDAISVPTELENSAQVGDASVRVSNSGAVWLLGVVGAVAIIVIVIGFGRGYDHEVVVQEAQEEVTREVSTGSFRVLETSERICGVGEDFQFCLGQHIAVYNANCAERDLEVFSALRCNRFLEFIDGAEATLQSCGFGCVTTSDNNTWGWRYLTVEPATAMKTVREARERVTELRRCNFDLGPITFGDCGVDPSRRLQFD